MKKILVALLCFLTVCSLFAVSPKEEFEISQIETVENFIQDLEGGYVYTYHHEDLDEETYQYASKIINKYNVFDKLKENGWEYEFLHINNDEDFLYLYKEHWTFLATADNLVGKNDKNFIVIEKVPNGEILLFFMTDEGYTIIDIW